MNERINGLWWKARIGYNNQSCDPEVLEKFAELIVKECCSAIRLDDAFNGGKFQRTILKHFGVEE
jgi:hypothetical protein